MQAKKFGAANFCQRGDFRVLMGHAFGGFAADWSGARPEMG
jgi:enterochelin esterase-like enzyme